VAVFLPKTSIHHVEIGVCYLLTEPVAIIMGCGK